MKIQEVFSPNYDRKKRPIKAIKFIVIHYTGMQSERESVKRLCSSRTKVSTHYLIGRSGKILRMVKDSHVAWHAGESCWGKYNNLNKNSIGIELVNKGHRFGYENFSKKQISNLLKLCKKLIKKYKIKKKNIVGHSDVAPLRKADPGEKFPWGYLAKNKIGIWHDCEHSLLKKCRKMKILSKQNKKKFIINIRSIGYCFPLKGKKFLAKTFKAFQRHFRRELINGVLDQECFIIAQNLAKRV